MQAPSLTLIVPTFAKVDDGISRMATIKRIVRKTLNFMSINSFLIIDMNSRTSPGSVIAASREECDLNATLSRIHTSIWSFVFLLQAKWMTVLHRSSPNKYASVISTSTLHPNNIPNNSC